MFDRLKRRLRGPKTPPSLPPSPEPETSPLPRAGGEDVAGPALAGPAEAEPTARAAPRPKKRQYTTEERASFLEQ